jgi:hypothetical protein
MDRITILRVIGTYLSDDELVQWVNSVSKGCLRRLFRESPSVCYLHFSRKDDTLFVKHYLNTQVFPAFDEYMVAETLPTFVENRYVQVFHAIDSPVVAPKSTFVKLCSSASLSLSEWIQIVPRAFDIHRTQSQSRVVVEFSNLKDAQESLEQLHGTTLDVMTKHGEVVQVLVAMQYVSEQYKVSSAKRIDSCLREKIKYEDILAQRVVDWLYL